MLRKTFWFRSRLDMLMVALIFVMVLIGIYVHYFA